MRPENGEDLIENPVGRKDVLPQKPRNHPGNHARKIIRHAEAAHGFEGQIDETGQQIADHKDDRHVDKRIKASVAEYPPKSGSRKNTYVVFKSRGIIIYPRIFEKRPYQRLDHWIQGKYSQSERKRKGKHPPFPIAPPKFFQPYGKSRRSAAGGNRISLFYFSDVKKRLCRTHPV